ncbi:hypothetical protein BVY04_04755 [bacterium M21]|nr:hypothetical protein BVY04_04755 [bacterium M21]
MEKRTVCWGCGEEYSEDMLAAFGERLICGGCKPNYVQSVKENVQPKSAIQVGPDWLATSDLGLGGLLGRTFETYGRVFKPCLLMAVVIMGPLYLLMLALKVIAIQTSNPLLLMGNGILGLIAAILGFAPMIGVVHSVHRSTYGEMIDWRTALSFGFRRFGDVFGTAFLGGLIVLGLFFLGIVPGIIWAIYYSFIIAVVAVTYQTGKDALDYSKSLVKGRWWRIFGYIFVINLLVVFSTILFAGAGAGLGIVHPVAGAIVGTGGEFINILLSYMGLTFSTLLFLNLHYQRQAEIGHED